MMSSRLRAGAAAIVVLAAVAVAAGASAVPPRQTYLQFNMCGNMCNDGGLPAAVHLAGSIRTGRPFAVTLNEVCENQYERLRADLAAYRGQFDPTGPRCRNGARYGNAVLVRTTSLEPVGSWPLPSPAGGESRRLLCVHARPAGGGDPTAEGVRTLVVCVTHISYVGADIGVQVATVADIVRGLARNGAVLLGGDFNADPADARMNPLYRACDGGGTGRFDEVDSGGCAGRSMTNRGLGLDVVNEDTLQRHKLDYIFLSSGDWVTSRADARAAGNSDHDALWATATRRGVTADPVTNGATASGRSP
jgi:endonuclease/exonuclease/phosphatase family metal-dependent hydrolase